MNKFRISRGWVILSDTDISIETSNSHVLRYAYEQSRLYFALYVGFIALSSGLILIGLYLWANTILISQGILRYFFLILSAGGLALLAIGPKVYRKHHTNMSTVNTIPLNSVIGVVYREQVTLMGHKPAITIFFEYDEEIEGWKRRVLRMSLLGVDGSAEVNQMTRVFGAKGITTLSGSEFENRKTVLQEQNDEATPQFVFCGFDRQCSNARTDR